MGGAATLRSHAAHAQQPHVFRIGILWRGQENEAIVQAQQHALREELMRLNWIEDQNVHLELRYSGDDPNRIRQHAEALVRLNPDVIVASSFPVAQAVVQHTHRIPIVFINVGDPVAGGLVKSIPRPEGNATGITSTYQSLGSKWLDLLKEAAPRTSRAALIYEPENVNHQYFALIDATAERLRVKTVQMPYRTVAELQRAIETFAKEPNGALLMVPPPPAPAVGESINRLAAKHQLPTIYSSKYYVSKGGLMSYGSPIVETYRIAATYIDRILRGAMIRELPVQFPTKLELAVNLKTAKELGLSPLPKALLLSVTDVIE